MLRLGLASRAAAAAGLAALTAATITSAASAHSDRDDERMMQDALDRVTGGGGGGGGSGRSGAVAQRGNKVLAQKHRVALGFWPVLGARVVGDQRVRSLRACLDWTRRAGYDGVELSVSDIKALFFSPDTPLEEVVRDTNAAAKAAGVEIFGGTYHLVDGNKWTYAGEVTESSPCRDGMRQRPMFDVDQSGWRDELRANFAHDKAMGCGYATFQVFLPERHLNTGGAYRRDKAYLQQCADRIGVIQRLCWEEGLNCYIETHIERITEDLEAFNEIMDLAPEGLELNADLSHYLYRNITRGRDLEAVMARVGHMHGRLARPYGDLSADAPVPSKDWKAGGPTKLLFDYSKPALAGGLSSRVIMGESGPMHLVEDALSLDAKLVPLWRMMARYADRQVGEEWSENPFSRW